MSDQPLGQFQFLSLARQGIATAIEGLDDGSPLPGRASVDVQLSLNAQNGTATMTSQINRTVQLFGPGDVIGIDLRHIVRTVPSDGTMTFEPNYLCHIEFDLPDFPWLCTPASAATPGDNPNVQRLRPWLALIALKVGEFDPPVQSQPLPYIKVQQLDALHDLSVSWAWAHTQVNGSISISDNMKSTPGNVISRLLCPRRLEAATAYTAFLVPAFDIGVAAGLGQDVSTASAAGPAWNSPTQALPLPIYYKFQFHTAPDGDFETVVRRLKKQAQPAGVGWRSVDASQAVALKDTGSYVKFNQPFNLFGALAGPAGLPSTWHDSGDNKTFRDVVQPWINKQVGLTDNPDNPLPDDPEIVAPKYGRWYARNRDVNRDRAEWIDTLNLDPSNRNAAGLGVQIVQQERTQLLASAWQQIAGVPDANQKLKQAQLARSVLQQIYNNRLKPLSDETALLLTAPVHGRVLFESATVRGEVRTKRVPESVFYGSFRKLTRPRITGGTKSLTGSILSKINSGKIAVIPPPKLPDGTPRLPDGLVPIEKITADHLQTIEKKLVQLLAALALALRSGGSLSRRLFLLVAMAGVGLALAGVSVWELLEKLLRASTHLKGVAIQNFTPQAVDAIPRRPNFTITTPGTQPSPLGSGGPDSPQAKAFRGATEDLFAVFQARPKDPDPLRPLDLGALKQTVLNALNPNFTVPARMKTILSLSRLSLNPVDPLDPIPAAPQFPQPMYVPLRNLSPSFLLPGVDLIPAESVTLVASNQSFIESYMCGLNDEMTRLLMWDGYLLPSQRGTYFRQFWDVSIAVSQQGDLSDITPIDGWDNRRLGQNVPPGKPSGGNIVLLIRGELLRRYPKTAIYLGKAKLDPTGTRVLDEDHEYYSVFNGTLGSDITFMGYDLSAAEVTGNPQGYFVVFEEHPTEQRFGLEPAEPIDSVTRWADLAWTNFVAEPSPTLNSFRPGKGQSKMSSTATGRRTSQLFATTDAARQLPRFLSPLVAPNRVKIAATHTDSSVNWGASSAQTASALLRQPYRIVVDAQLLFKRPTS
jgi:hypothetical protein